MHTTTQCMNTMMWPFYMHMLFFLTVKKTNKKHLFKFPFNSKAAVHTNSSSFTPNFIQVPWIQIYLLLPGGVHSEKAAAFPLILYTKLRFHKSNHQTYLRPGIYSDRKMLDSATSTLSVTQINSKAPGLRFPSGAHKYLLCSPSSCQGEKMQTHAHTIRVWLESVVVCVPLPAVGRGW